MAFEVLRLLELSSVGGSRGNRMRLGRVWLSLWAMQRLGIRRRRALRVDWMGPSGPLSALVADTSELRVLWELFFAREYELPTDFRPDTIVDLGSNCGLSVLHFNSLYPDARIVAVEPIPETFARLVANTAHLPGVTCVNAAMSDRDGTLTLYVGRKSWNAAAVPDASRPTARRVEAITLESVLARTGTEGIDLLKVDIEGAETAVLPNSPAVRTAKMIVFEFHRNHADESVWALIAKLPGFELLRIRNDSETRPLVTLRRAPHTPDPAAPRVTARRFAASAPLGATQPLAPDPDT